MLIEKVPQISAALVGFLSTVVFTASSDPIFQLKNKTNRAIEVLVSQSNVERSKGFEMIQAQGYMELDTVEMGQKTKIEINDCKGEGVGCFKTVAYVDLKPGKTMYLKYEGIRLNTFDRTIKDWVALLAPQKGEGLFKKTTTEGGYSLKNNVDANDISAATLEMQTITPSKTVQSAPQVVQKAPSVMPAKTVPQVATPVPVAQKLVDKAPIIENDRDVLVDKYMKQIYSEQDLMRKLQKLGHFTSGMGVQSLDWLKKNAESALNDAWSTYVEKGQTSDLKHLVAGYYRYKRAEIEMTKRFEQDPQYSVTINELQQRLRDYLEKGFIVWLPKTLPDEGAKTALLFEYIAKNLAGEQAIVFLIHKFETDGTLNT